MANDRFAKAQRFRVVECLGECGRGARIEYDPRRKRQRDYKLRFRRYVDAGGGDNRVAARYRAVKCVKRDALIDRMPKRRSVFFAVLCNRKVVAQMRHRVHLRRILREQQGQGKNKLWGTIHWQRSLILNATTRNRGKSFRGNPWAPRAFGLLRFRSGRILTAGRTGSLKCVSALFAWLPIDSPAMPLRSCSGAARGGACSSGRGERPPRDSRRKLSLWLAQVRVLVSQA